MGDANLNTQHTAFRLKGRFFPLSVLHLINPDIHQITAQLDTIVQQAPHLLKNAPLIIDLDTLNPACEMPNFSVLHSVLRSYGLIPIGVGHANEAQAKAAIKGGFAVLPNLPDEQTQSSHKPKKIQATKTKLVTSPIRSGQQVYAKNADLIVLNSVSPGSEILADGHIHVYGRLRGRALAGVSGDKNARIFCQILEAELVSIAGCYMLHEAMHEAIDGLYGAHIQIYLLDGHLRMDSIS